MSQYPTEPCPFCGSVVLSREGFHMTCIRCGADGPDGDWADDAAAVAAWNRRAQVPAVEPLTDEKRDAARYRVLREQRFVGLPMLADPANPGRVKFTPKGLDMACDEAIAFYATQSPGSAERKP